MLERMNRSRKGILMNKALLWMTVGIIILGSCAIVGLSVEIISVRLIDLGTFAVLATTLVALVFYASDTNRLARITQSKWERDTILDATYEMVGSNDKATPGRILFRLHNPSRLIIRAKVWAEFRV
jgi:hypothetical protein